MPIWISTEGYRPCQFPLEQNSWERSTMADNPSFQGMEEVQMTDTGDDASPVQAKHIEHYLTMFGSTLSVALLLAGPLCVGSNTLVQSEILSTMLFVSGLVTLLQTTLGVRLPIVQGGSMAFVVPTFAILGLKKCPADISAANGTTEANIDESGIWKSRIREIQGAIILASLFQVGIGILGIAGFIIRFIGPLAVAPTITLIGLSLFEVAATNCAGQWWIALATMALIVICSQYMRKIRLPMCCGSRDSIALFQLFPVILAIIIMWLVCGILTWTDALPENSSEWGYVARVDAKSQVLTDAKWFRFPYPFQWGWPIFSVAATFGMLAGALAGMVESMGDYYACARLSGAPPVPLHAMNRGILMEGIGCVLVGMWGTGNGTTSYSENIGAIGITKVASRRVVQATGIILLCLGMLGKFGAFFVTMPTPILGGVLMALFGMIAAVGISNLQYVDLNSTRNLFIFGFSTFFGLSFPRWVSSNPISVGHDEVDQIITVLCSTSMFVGGAIAFFLDNTIPGTAEERGINKWRTMSIGVETSDALAECYDLPLISPFLKRLRFTRYIPFCPAFNSHQNND